MLGRSHLKNEIVNFAVRVKHCRGRNHAPAPFTAISLQSKAVCMLFPSAAFTAGSLTRGKNVLSGEFPGLTFVCQGHTDSSGSSFGGRTLISYLTCAVCSSICSWPGQSHSAIRCSSLPYSSLSSSSLSQSSPSAFWRH